MQFPIGFTASVDIVTEGKLRELGVLLSVVYPYSYHLDETHTSLVSLLKKKLEQSADGSERDMRELRRSRRDLDTQICYMNELQELLYFFMTPLASHLFLLLHSTVATQNETMNGFMNQNNEELEQILER